MWLCGSRHRLRPWEGPQVGVVKSLGRRRCHLVVCRPPSGKCQQKKRWAFQLPCRSENGLPTAAGLQLMCYQLWNPTLGPCALSLLPLLTNAPSLFLHPQGIWSCHLQASGKVAQVFPWSKQDVKPFQVPNRTHSSTCLKLNSWIKSRTSKLTAWNHHTTAEGLSSP